MMNIKKAISVVMIAMCCAIVSYGCNGKNKSVYYGKWRNGNTQIEVTQDTIYIDEIGVEGFGYAYDYDPDNDRFYLHDMFGGRDLVLEFREVKDKRKSLIKITAYYYGSKVVESTLFRRVKDDVGK